VFLRALLYKVTIFLFKFAHISFIGFLERHDFPCVFILSKKLSPAKKRHERTSQFYEEC